MHAIIPEIMGFLVFEISKLFITTFRLFVKVQRKFDGKVVQKQRKKPKNKIILRSKFRSWFKKLPIATVDN